MKYTDIKEGDIITILEKPPYWSSGCIDSSPMQIKFPYTGIVYKISQREDHLAAHIGEYGWDLKHLKFTITHQNYEIY